MQEFFIIIIVIAAGLYIFSHVKKKLTEGENSDKCKNCHQFPNTDHTKNKPSQDI
jgi:hypothetical protein